MNKSLQEALQMIDQHISERIQVQTQQMLMPALEACKKEMQEARKAVVLCLEEVKEMLATSLQQPTSKMVASDEDELLTRAEAAQLLGISTQTVRSMGDRGMIKCFMMGRRSRYSKKELLAYIAHSFKNA